MTLALDTLLAEMVEHGASDCLLKAGAPPALKIDGVVHLTEHPALTPEETEATAQGLMNPEQQRRFEQSPEMDLAHTVAGIGRFRVNIFRQRGAVGLALRAIPPSDLTFEDLHLPTAVRSLAESPRGLALVTGTAGSGKSTTLAAMVHHINTTRACHVVTIEDPIEFLHTDQMAFISQREVGIDTRDFGEALRHVLRQAPDVILIGEMRDIETIRTAISAAETGHLILSTLHTTDAVQTIDRIINHFPAHLHAQVRAELSVTLQGVISQRLLPLAVGRGRVPAVEVMLATPTVRALILEGKTLEIPQHIHKGAHVGMQSFNQSIVDLCARRLISGDEALAAATDPDALRLLLSGITSGIEAKGRSRFSV